MTISEILNGELLKRLLQGAAAGAAALALIGFTWGGWVTGGTAMQMAEKSASTAVVSALAPICVDNFQHSAKALENMAELKKVGYSWEQGKYIEKGGWATMPGSASPDAAVARACAEMLATLK
jgi:hypothetical protein